MSYYATEKRRSLPENSTMAITIIICLICWGLNYLYSGNIPETHVCKIPIHKEIFYAVGILAMIAAGFMMQRTNDREMFLRERTRLPLMLFLLFFSTNTGLLPAGRATVVVICLMPMLMALFKSYQLPEATVTFFNAGVYLGIAVCFVPQMLFFAPVMWIGMYYFRALEFKSFLASFVGLTSFAWIALAWCVWKGDFSAFAGWWGELAHFNFFSTETLFRYSNAALVGMLILTLVACFYVKMDSFTNSVRTRMMLSVLIYMAVLPVFLIFLYSDRADAFLSVVYLMDAALVACFLEIVKRGFRFVLFYLMLIIMLFSFVASIWKL